MPATLRLALGLLWTQFVALTGLLVFFVSMVLRKPSPLGLYVTLFGIAILVGLFVAVRLLHRLRRSGRASAVALQLLFLAPAYYMISSRLWLGWVLAAWSLAMTAALFAPATSRTLS